MHYLPLSLPFFSILVGVFAMLLVLLQFGALRYAYLSIGLSPGGAMLVLFGSLVGSYFNIPLAELPRQHIVAGHVVHYFGMRYVVPVVVNWPGTVIAANVGGAIIPVVVSAYLLIRCRLWLRASLAVTCIAIVSHLLAHPVRGLGIAVPVFVPAVATAITASVLSRQICRSIGLYRRQHRHAHWRRPDEPGETAGAGGSCRLDWGCRDVRWHLPDRRPRRADRWPYQWS